MRVRTAIRYGFLAVIAVVLLSLVLGHVLGQPILLSYVDSDSMEPTLNAGDGYIAVPTTLAGDVEEGDVITYESETIGDGERTTHRVVDERDGGYVTRGDNNVVTDQDGGEPLVTDGQIQAVALEVNGEVVRVPHLGTAVVTVESAVESAGSLFGADGIADGFGTYLLFGAGIVSLAASVLVGGGRGRDARERTRERSNVIDSRLLLVGAIVLVCLAATLAMTLPAGTETYGIVSTEGDSVDPTIIPVGETDDFNYTLHNGGVVPTATYLEEGSNGIEIDRDRATLSGNESVNATVTLHAQDETGYHTESMTERRYLLVLPPTIIDALYDVHPLAPYPAIYVVLAAPIVGFWWVFGGTSDKVRLRSRTRKDSGGLLDRF